MFADLDETIRQLLRRDFQPDLVDEVDVSFDAPDREWSGRLTRSTVNCFLYDVRENKELREAAWEYTRDDTHRTLTRRQLPIRINTTYNVTVWARAPEDEHYLLWRVLAALARHPILPDEVVQGSLKDQPFPVLARVGQPEQARTNPADLWQAVDNRIRPSLTYVVTLALDPDVAFTKPMPMTFTRVMRTRANHTIDGQLDEVVHVSGRVLDHRDGSPVAGARVRLKERGAETVTAADGGFVFTSVPRATVTLIAQAPGGQEVATTVEVPSPHYDLEV